MIKDKDMKTKQLFSLLFFTLIYFGCYAQTFNKPKEPTFDYLTIDIASGQPILHWTAPSFDPQYPNPIGYIIYRGSLLGSTMTFFEIDTVGQNTFTYTDINANGNNERLHYKIASLGLTEPSRLSPEHAQIWLTTKYDSCNAKLDLYWDHYYNLDINGWSNPNRKKYQLYWSNSPDINSFQLLSDSISIFTNKYSISNVQENTNYYFYLTLERKDKPYKTYSNLNHIFTKMAIHPDYMYLDSIIAKEKGMYIYYKIDPFTEIKNFKLIRWEHADTSRSIFSAKIIEEFSDPTKTHSIDSNDNWAARTRKFYYKIDAYNGCNAVIKTTNLCNTIIPKVRPKGIKVHLEWDTLLIDTERQPFRQGNNVEYIVYRQAYTQNEDITGPGELNIAASGISEAVFDDDLSSFKGHDPLYKIIFKYFIEAIERRPDNSGITFVRSREAIIEILPDVIMPTAIAPNSSISNNNRSRNIFEPIISFDAKYTLTIYDRWGGIIYYGNQGWNGQNKNGEYVKEGTYIYRLVITTDDSGDVIKEGSVSVVYPK